MDIAELGFRADSSQLKGAIADLDGLRQSSEGIDENVNRLGASFDKGKVRTKEWAAEMKKAEASANALNDDLHSLRAEFDPLFARSKKYELQLKKLNGAHKLGALNAKQYEFALERLNRDLAGTSDAARNAGRSMRGMDFRNTALQLSQVAQQGTATGNVMQALAIQLPDLAIGFGPIGILAGAAAGALLPLALNMFGVGSEAETTAEKVDNLSDSLEALKSVRDAANQGLPDLAAIYGAGATAAKEVLQIQRDIAEVEATRAAGSLSSAVATNFGDLEGFLTRGIQGDIEKIVRAAARMQFQLRATAPDAMALAEALREIGRVDTGEGKLKALADARRALTQAVGPYSENLTQEAKDLFDVLLKAELKQAELNALVRDSEGAAQAQTEEAKELLRELEAQADMLRLIERYGEDSKQVTEARIDAERQVFEEMLATRDISEELKDELVEAWNAAKGVESTDMASRIRRAAEAAKDMLGYIVEAAREANTFSFERMTSGIFKNLPEMTPKGVEDWAFKNIGADMRTAQEPLSNFNRKGMDPSAVRALSLLEQAAQKTFKINSAHRDEAHNAKVGGANKSQHIQGRAFDIDVSGMAKAERIAIIKMARQVGFGGVGVYQNALHLDTGPQRQWGPNFKSDSVPAWAEGALRTKQAGGPDTKSIEKTARSFDRLMGSFDPLIAVTKRYEDAQKTINEALEAGAISAAEASQAHTLAREKMQEDLAAIEAQGRAGYESLIGSLDPATAALQRLQKAQEQVSEALREGSITAQEAANALALAQEQYSDTIERINEQENEEQFGDLLRNIESVSDAIANAIVNGENLGEALGAVFRQMAADLISSGIQEMINGLFSGGGGGGGGGNWLSGIFSSIFGGPRAEGGPVSPSKGYIVGEEGPEWFQPSSAGQIIPNDEMQKSSSIDMLKGIAAQPAPATKVESGVSKEDLAEVVSAIREMRIENVIVNDRREIGNYLFSPEGKRKVLTIMEESGR